MQINNIRDIGTPVNVKLLKIYDDVRIPEYKTSGSSGMDVRAYFTEDFIKDFKRFNGNNNGMDDGVIAIPPHKTIAIPTGLKVKIPENYEMQVRSRSGLSLDSLIVANQPGTVDCDFVGEIKIIILNTSDMYKYIKNGDRIAQLILSKVEKASFCIVNELTETNRGEGCLGSTGIN